MHARCLTIGDRIMSRAPAPASRYVGLQHTCAAQKPVAASIGSSIHMATEITHNPSAMHATARVGARMEPIGAHLAIGKEHPRDRDRNGKIDHDKKGKKTGWLKGENKIKSELTIDDSDAALIAMGMVPDARTQPVGAALDAASAPERGNWQRLSPSEVQQLVSSQVGATEPIGRHMGTLHAMVVIKNRSDTDLTVLFSSTGAPYQKTVRRRRQGVLTLPPGTYSMNIGGTLSGHQLENKQFLAGHAYTLRLSSNINGVSYMTLTDVTRNPLRLVRGEMAEAAASDLVFEPYSKERAQQLVAPPKSRVGWQITPVGAPISNAWTVKPVGAAVPTPSSVRPPAQKPIHAYRMAELASTRRALVRLDMPAGTSVTAVSPSGERVPLGPGYTPISAGIHDWEIQQPGKPVRTLHGAVVLHAGSEYMVHRRDTLLVTAPEEEHAATRLSQFAPGLKAVPNSVLIVDRAANTTAVAPVGTFLQVQQDDYTLRTKDGREYAVSPSRLDAWDPQNVQRRVHAVFAHPSDPTATVLVIGD